MGEEERWKGEGGGGGMKRKNYSIWPAKFFGRAFSEMSHMRHGELSVGGDDVFGSQRSAEYLFRPSSPKPSSK